MTDDAATRARVAGRQAVAERTAWQLQLATGVAVRCVRLDGDRFRWQLQLRQPGGRWEGLENGDDPVLLLQRVALVPAVRKLIEMGM